MYLDLGLMPLANNLETTSEKAKAMERHPLQVMFCEECSLSQLSVVVDPSVLYSHYVYRSSINGGYVRHCREMAIQLKNKYNLTKDSFHIDIAGNDGALLKEFQEEIGLRGLNVDPAENLCKIAHDEGVVSVPEFWSQDLAKFIVDIDGKADLITATNVFAHVDNVEDFILAAKLALKKEGVLVLEFPYLVDFIENMEFDTIYFEHLSYFSLLPIMKLCGKTDMKVIAAEKKKIHGGTLRVTIANEQSTHEVNRSVSTIINSELDLGYDKIEAYKDWAGLVYKSINGFKLNIEALKKKGYKIAGFAASAKGNTLLNSAKLDETILDYISDETPEKIGLFSPGTGISIYDKEHVELNPPDYLIILSWNFKDELIQKLNKIYKGKYLIPIPDLVCSYVINIEE
jgi:hypothetical protein